MSLRISTNPAKPMERDRIAILLTRIHHNDETALADIYDRYAGAVYSVAFQVVQQAQDAEEITQDVFLRIWHKAETFDSDKGNFLTWLLTITRRTAIDYLRKHNRTNQVPNPLSLDEHVYLWETIPNKENFSELHQSLVSALKELPTEYREAIQLAYFRGMPQVEIAKQLNRPLGTVKSHIREGMERLRLVWMAQEDKGGGD